MNKKTICIIGPPGTGKTTLANILANTYDYKILAMDDIDDIFQKCNDRLPNKEEWLKTLKDELKSNKYQITEGFYRESVEDRLKISNIVIYYNIGTLRCLWFAYIRGIKNLFVETSAHPITRISLEERIKYCFSPRLYWKIFTFNKRNKKYIQEKLGELVNVRIYEIKKRKDIDMVLDSIDKDMM